MNETGMSSAMFAEFEPSLHLPMMMENGVTQVELSTNCFEIWNDAKRLANLQSAIADSGIGVNSIHAPFSGEIDISHPDPALRRETLDKVLLCLERLVEVGGKYLVVHPSAEPIDDADRLRRMATSLESCEFLSGRMPKDGSAKIALECLPRTCLTNSSREVLALTGRLDETLFGVCQDVNHANCREDLLTATRAYASRVATLHISDNDGVDERHWLPGLGVIPWRDWAPVLLDAGFEGPWMYEVGILKDDAGRALTDEEIVRGVRRNAEEWFCQRGEIQILQQT